MTDSIHAANDVALQKKNLRKEIRARLKSLDYARDQIADAFYRNLISLERFRSAKTVGFYVDFRNEAPTQPILHRLFDSQKILVVETVAVPYCVGVNLRFHKLAPPVIDPTSKEARFSDLEPSEPYGILEPLQKFRNDPERYVSPESIDVLIVPGLAFDESGRRLGRGAGYYDRYIPLLRSDALTVGVCFDEQLVGAIPTDELDAYVDVVVTPTKVLRGAN